MRLPCTHWRVKDARLTARRETIRSPRSSKSALSDAGGPRGARLLAAIVVIPARYGSTRFPAKILACETGKPLVQHVVERARLATRVRDVLVATDDERIVAALERFGTRCVMTSPAHQSGTDRIAEVARGLGNDVDVIVNVQGDEPQISPRTIEQAVAALHEDTNAACATVCEAVGNASDVLSPDIVKVISDRRGHALYFSRSPIPYPREAARKTGSLAAALEAQPALLSLFRKHTGLYVYRRAFLLEYARWPQSALERAESLEQLRMLEHGVKIRVVETDETSIGVDTLADLEHVRAMFVEKKDIET